MELVNGKPYKGPMALFGEPIFAYVKTHLKGQRKWYKCIFLGKIDGQDAHIVYDGEKFGSPSLSGELDRTGA